ncbi:MAG: hypothetical protein NVS1B10_05610 [Candidatus Saccharimonadales bacterium]
MSSFKKYVGVIYDASNIKTLEVKVLDIELKDLKYVDLFKVDVEGFEQEVIKGSFNILKRSNYLLIEIGLSRELSAGTNLSLLSSIINSCPHSSILKFGRPLGNKYKPICQDALICLSNNSNDNKANL